MSVRESSRGVSRLGLVLAIVGLAFVGLGCRRQGPESAPANGEPAVSAQGPEYQFALATEQREAFESAMASEVPNRIGDSGAQRIMEATPVNPNEFALSGLGNRTVGGTATWLDYGGYVIIDLNLDPDSLDAANTYDVWVFKSWSGREKMKIGTMAVAEDGRWKLRFAALSWQMATYDSIVFADVATGTHAIEGSLISAD